MMNFLAPFIGYSQGKIAHDFRPGSSFAGRPEALQVGSENFHKSAPDKAPGEIEARFPSVFIRVICGQLLSVPTENTEGTEAD